jgi:dTDP-4-dehydrorhamnose 3,5-epimerase-like enzyme
MRHIRFYKKGIDKMKKQTKQNKKTYYKIVREVGGKLTSCVTDKDDGGVNYSKSRWTAPSIKNSKLFIFKNRESARDFKREMLEDEKCYIYKVAAVNPQEIELYEYDPKDIDMFYTLSDEEIFYRTWNCKDENDMGNIIYMPKGTLFADKVKLIEKAR